MLQQSIADCSSSTTFRSQLVRMSSLLNSRTNSS